MAEAEVTTFDFTEYDKLNAEKATEYVEKIDNWDEYVAVVEHEQAREKPRSTVLTSEVLDAYEEGKKELADTASASETQEAEQGQASEAQADPAVSDDPSPETDEPFVSEEQAVAEAEERQKHQDQVTAFLKERRGYVLYGTDDQVANVDAELDRLGYEGDRDITF